MTKADIVRTVYKRIGGFSKAESAALVDLVFDLMKRSLGSGKSLKLNGFGNFVLHDKRERMGRDPHTCEPKRIVARRVLSFHPSPILRKLVNRGALTDRMPADPVTSLEHTE